MSVVRKKRNVLSLYGAQEVCEKSTSFLSTVELDANSVQVKAVGWVLPVYAGVRRELRSHSVNQQIILKASGMLNPILGPCNTARNRRGKKTSEPKELKF